MCAISTWVSAINHTRGSLYLEEPKFLGSYLDGLKTCIKLLKTFSGDEFL